MIYGQESLETSMNNHGRVQQYEGELYLYQKNNNKDAQAYLTSNQRAGSNTLTNGASGGTWTPTAIRPADFESAVSTIPPPRHFDIGTKAY